MNGILVEKILHYLRYFYLFENRELFDAYLEISQIPQTYKFNEKHKSSVHLSILWLAEAIKENKVVERLEQLKFYLVCYRVKSHPTVLELDQIIEELKIAYLQLTSNNSNFSHVISKNPQSGLLAKEVRHGLQNTAAELTWHGLELEFDEEKSNDRTNNLYIKSAKASQELHDLANWLDTLPACLRILHNGEEWRASHAYVPSAQSSFEPFPAKYERYIYGPNNKKDGRLADDSGYVNWWEPLDDNYTRNFKFIAGHSHNVYMGKNLIINDPDEQGKIGLVFFEDGKKPRFEVM